MSAFLRAARRRVAAAAAAARLARRPVLAASAAAAAAAAGVAVAMAAQDQQLAHALGRGGEYLMHGKAGEKAGQDSWLDRVWMPWAAGFDPRDFIEDEEDPVLTASEREKRWNRNEDRIARWRAGLTDKERQLEDRSLMPFNGYVPHLDDGDRDRYKYTLVITLEKVLMDALFGSPTDHLLSHVADVPHLSDDAYMERRIRQPEYKKTEGYMYRRRRGFENMLQRLRSAGYEIIFVTRRGAREVLPALQRLDRYAMARWLVIGEQLRMTNGLDLDEMNRDLERLVYVDTMQKVAGLEPRHRSNALTVPDMEFLGPADDALLPLTVFLETLAAMNVKDVRPYLERMQTTKNASWRQIFGDAIENVMPSERVLEQPANRGAEVRGDVAERLERELDQQTVRAFMKAHEELTPEMLNDPTKETPVSEKFRDDFEEHRLMLEYLEKRGMTAEELEKSKWEFFPRPMHGVSEEQKRQKVLDEFAAADKQREELAKLGTGEGVLLGGKPFAELDAQHLWVERRLESERRMADDAMSAGVLTEATRKELYEETVHEDFAKVGPNALMEDVMWAVADSEVYDKLMWRYEKEPQLRLNTAEYNGTELYPVKHEVRGVPPPDMPFDELRALDSGDLELQVVAGAHRRMREHEAHDAVVEDRVIALDPEDRTVLGAAREHAKGAVAPLLATNPGAKVAMAPPTLIGHRLLEAGAEQYSLDNLAARAFVQNPEMFDTEADRDHLRRNRSGEYKTTPEERFRVVASRGLVPRDVERAVAAGKYSAQDALTLLEEEARFMVALTK